VWGFLFFNLWEQVMNILVEQKKSKIRYEYLMIRNKIEFEARNSYSSGILEKIKSLKIYAEAKTIMLYLSYGSEVITDIMIKDFLLDGKEVAVPIILTPGDGIMQAIKINSLEECNVKVYGIRQPEFDENLIVDKNDVDLILVPGIVFDEKGYRIGYGKGYYDRWLDGTDIKKRIGLAYEVQVVSELPKGKYDLPVGMLVTEKQIKICETNLA